MTEKSKTLTDIFANTASVTFGPFAIVKNSHKTFDEAKFFVDGTEVPMQAAQKKVMAMLISQQGSPLNLMGFINAMDTEHYAELAREIGESRGAALQKAIRKASSNLRTQVSHIHTAIIQKFGPGTPETIRYLEMFQRVSSYTSHRATQRHMQSGYRLNINEPTADL